MARRSLALYLASALAAAVAASSVSPGLLAQEASRLAAPGPQGRAQGLAHGPAQGLAQGLAQGPDQGQPPAPPGLDFDPAAVSRRQPLLLQQALAELEGARTTDRAADRPADQSADQPPRLFFVGFAGYGWEGVFKREALAVQALFDERFGTRGRSLVLVNHPSTVEGIALASPENLQRVLRHVGALMRRDGDTLFLFLTSHGRKDLFAVDMPGFAFDGLTPDALRAMLDHAGIRSRVVVISACHSGSFVPALADPATLVIAAAHAERSSFGCEDRREWTYFGDAFFNRALRRERSFERAFQLARRTIGRWERQERLVPSLPQIAGGEALRTRLEEMARGAR